MRNMTHMYPNQYTYNKNSAITTDDVNISEIIKDILYGTPTEKPRGTWAVLQSLKRDSNGEPIKSDYVYKLTGEGVNSGRGPGTTRTGYLCDEKLVRTYYRPASRMIMDELTSAVGVFAPTRDVCYFANIDPIYEHDVIVFIELDADGSIINPVKAIKELNVVRVYDKRLDNGLVQYYACVVEDQK